MRCFKVDLITFQSHSFYRAIWVILRGEMAGITVQNGQDWNARYKSLIINRSDTPLRSNVCRDARLVRPPQCFGIFAFNSPCTDARFVRPYMPRSMQLVHPVHLFICQPRGVDARTVRPYMPRSMQLVHPVYLFTRQPRRADARAVRPYILTLSVLMHKIID